MTLLQTAKNSNHYHSRARNWQVETTLQRNSQNRFFCNAGLNGNDLSIQGEMQLALNLFVGEQRAFET
jgi:hypothetical protein